MIAINVLYGIPNFLPSEYNESNVDLFKGLDFKDPFTI
jgi:hypothetical protein